MNYAAYAAYLHYIGRSGATPAVGVTLGSLAGLRVNFTLSGQLFFRKPNSPAADTLQ